MPRVLARFTVVSRPFDVLMELKLHLVGRESCAGENCRVTANSIIKLYEKNFCMERERI